MKKVLLLGASGSIGSQSIDVINQNKDEFELTAFSVGKRVECVESLIKEHKKIKHIYVINSEIAKKFSKKYPHIKFYSGKNGLAKITEKADYDMCVDALVGFAGLEPAIIALKRNKILCLANKEALVTGGTLISKYLVTGHGKLYPIDSEHVALAKCLSKCEISQVKNLIITASGGALRNVPIEDLGKMTKDDALKHPTWKMGAKITIDCATMMNKGFEIIEAFYLYHFPLDQIKVQMHDESLVHSMVELKDGTLLVDYGKPDMHNPIAWAMMEGELQYDVLRIKSLSELKDCHFHEYDAKRYPCTELAKKALVDGASKMIALNAANEVAVNRFLNDEIKFTDIAKIVDRVVKATPIVYKPSLRQIKKIDKISRKRAY
jgi:1-deoxy-D-xylulose-5-phosphate reductoisomerase